MKKIVVIILFLALSLLYTSSSYTAAENAHTETQKIIIYFFWGDGCPHCEREKVFLAGLMKKYPQVEIKSYEVWYDPMSADFFAQMVKAAGIKATGVPVTFIDKTAFTGYSENTGTAIEGIVKKCVDSGCIDPVEMLSKPAAKEEQEEEEEGHIDIPFLGRVDPSKTSLLILTIIIGVLDSFNPCAFFVLFFLLSLLIYAKSRRRMLIVGGTFVFLSGVIYFLFMAAWLNIFLITGQMKIITTLAGIIALVIAAINIKDFFIFAKGVSLVIPEKAKPKLFERMRNLLQAASIMSMFAGTVLLAIAANTYELLCTVGFPMVFTRILTLHNLTSMQYYLYLILYNVVYIIPLFVIVIFFVITLGAKKLTEWQGRKLKLISGIMMLFLGIVLLTKQALLNNIFVALGLLAGALVLSLVVVLLTKKFTT